MYTHKPASPVLTMSLAPGPVSIVNATTENSYNVNGKRSPIVTVLALPVRVMSSDSDRL